MRNYLWRVIALAGVAMATTAVPAYTADTGAVAVSVTAQAPPAPCLTVTPGSVDFGTLPFSTNNVARSAGGGLSEGHQDIAIANCGTAGQNLLGHTTDATGPGGAWTPMADDGTIHPCPQVNRFYLELVGFTVSTLVMTGNTAAVGTSNGGPPAVFPAGSRHDFRLELLMPCQGSNGAGETKTLTATFTAVVP